MNSNSTLKTLVRVGLIAAALLAFAPVQAIDLGNASVMSMQGQRLKIAVPYGSDPGQKVSVGRFSINSIEVPAGQSAPQADDFVISKPESRNIVYFQSRYPVTAKNLKLVLNVADGEAKTVAYDIAIPPMQYAQTAGDANTAKSKRIGKRAKSKSSMAANTPMFRTPKVGRMLKAGAKECSC
jgi:hypothetical protein